MDTSNKRKERGLEIAGEYDGVTIIDSHRLIYHVQSQSDRNTRYIVRLSEINGDVGAGSCTCYDSTHGHRCKHQFAASAWQMSLYMAPVLADERGITLDHFEGQLLDQLCQPMQKTLGIRLVIILHAVQHLLNKNDGSTIIELDEYQQMIGKYCEGRMDRYHHDKKATVGIIQRYQINRAEIAAYTIGNRTYHHFA